MTNDYTQYLRPGGHAIAPTTARDGNNQIVWLLRCDCGRDFTSASMKTRKTFSCPPCIDATKGGKRKHDDVGTAIYATWANMKGRCYNPKVRSFKTYGARGITVCDEWRYNYVAYRAYIDTLGPRPTPQHTIDRINNDGNYEPGNLRWASKLEQTHNRTLS